jgi:hypothetical protein
MTADGSIVPQAQRLRRWSHGVCIVLPRIPSFTAEVWNTSQANPVGIANCASANSTAPGTTAVGDHAPVACGRRQAVRR